MKWDVEWSYRGRIAVEPKSNRYNHRLSCRSLSWRRKVHRQHGPDFTELSLSLFYRSASQWNSVGS